MFSKIYQKVSQVGLPLFLDGVKDIAIRKGLQIVYKFDRWHTLSPFAFCPYKNDVVKKVNKLPNLSTVVEVGCGLGDIISRIRCNRRIGIDLCPKVIKAAKVIHSDITFISGDILQISKLKDTHISVLIMVNWLHNIPETTIKDWITEIQKTTTIDYLLVDEIIHDPKSIYRYKHNFTNLFKDIAVAESNDDENESTPRKLTLYRFH